MTNEELRDYIDWEGGVDELIMHGLDSSEIEDAKVRKLWLAAVIAYASFKEAASALCKEIDY